MRNIKYGENKHNRTRPSVFMHMETPRVTVQGKITAMYLAVDGTPGLDFIIKDLPSVLNLIIADQLLNECQCCS